MADGLVTEELFGALAERCRAGVAAHVLLDAVGARKIPAAHVELMRRSGCHVVFFRPVRPWTVGRAAYRNHRRILVVDGRVGFTGGSGVSRKWMGNGRTENHWRDTDVRVEGPVVAHLQAAFVENWLEATGLVIGGDPYFPRLRRRRGGVHAQVVRSAPTNDNFSMYTTFLLAIGSARRSIAITNPYFIPDDTMTEALIGAVRRRVRVRILVPGRIDHAIVRHVSRGEFGPLLRGGIEIYEYRPALLHAKTMVVDGVWATIGSTNLINRSFALDDELNLVVYDATIGRRVEEIFEDDLQYSSRVGYEEWQRRGVAARLLERLAIPARILGLF